MKRTLRRSRGGGRWACLALFAAGLTVLTGCGTVGQGEPTPSGSHAPSTPTPSESPSAPTMTRLALISDFGTCDAGQQWTVDQVDSWRVDAIITAGDNTQNEEGCVPYSESVWGYFDQGSLGKGDPPLWPTLGNHDYSDIGAGLDAYRKAFPYLSDAADRQQRWYYENLGHVNLYVLDSETSPEELEEQRVWLRQTLSDQRATHPNAWNIVIFHRPAFTSGEHEDNREMRPTAGWDYNGWGADIVLAGHQHIFEDVVVDDLHYVTAGLGGTANSRVCPPELREGSRICLEGTGASMIEVTPAQFVLTYHQQDADGQTTVTDEIRLTR